MSKDTNRLLGHSDEADGIDEYDNPLPDWWVGLFWLTIVWAIGYGIHYHFIANRSPQKALAAEIAAAEARWPSQAPSAAVLVLSDDAAEAGEPVYQANCVPCHGPEGKGDGPSAASLNPKPRNHSDSALMDKLTDKKIAETVQMGGIISGYPNMPASPHIRGEELVADRDEPGHRVDRERHENAADDHRALDENARPRDAGLHVSSPPS